MKQEDAKAAIIREWMALSFNERQTESQAASFAMQIKDRYAFKCSGDRYQVIKGWLQRHLSFTPKTP
jgi:hypothetical protein